MNTSFVVNPPAQPLLSESETAAIFGLISQTDKKNARRKQLDEVIAALITTVFDNTLNKNFLQFLEDPKSDRYELRFRHDLTPIPPPGESTPQDDETRYPLTILMELELKEQATLICPSLIEYQDPEGGGSCANTDLFFDSPVESRCFLPSMLKQSTAANARVTTRKYNDDSGDSCREIRIMALNLPGTLYSDAVGLRFAGRVVNSATFDIAKSRTSSGTPSDSDDSSGDDQWSDSSEEFGGCRSGVEEEAAMVVINNFNVCIS